MTPIVDYNNDVIDLNGDKDDESPPRRILSSSSIANRTTKPAPSVLQTLPPMLNSSREAIRSANIQSFPSPFQASSFLDTMSSEGSDAEPFKYPYITSDGKENEGRATAMDMAMGSDAGPIKYPYITSDGKENEGRATVMATREDKASKNALQGLSKDKHFFGALLLSSVNEFVEAVASETRSKALWVTICNRVGLTALESRVEPSYQCVRKH